MAPGSYPTTIASSPVARSESADWTASTLIRSVWASSARRLGAGVTPLGRRGSKGSMAQAALIAVGLAIIVATIVLTAANYRALPQRIPLHFLIDGTINGDGPRPAAWLMPGFQLLLLIYAQIHARGFPARQLIMADCILALMWRAQALIIATAVSGFRLRERAEVSGFYIFLAFAIAIAVVATYFIRP